MRYRLPNSLPIFSTITNNEIKLSTQNETPIEIDESPNE